MVCSLMGNVLEPGGSTWISILTVYDGIGGNNIALQLVMDGLKLQSATPTFLDARDAILLADQVNNGWCELPVDLASLRQKGYGPQRG